MRISPVPPCSKCTAQQAAIYSLWLSCVCDWPMYSKHAPTSSSLLLIFLPVRDSAQPSGWFTVRSCITAPLDLCSSFTSMNSSGTWSKWNLRFCFLTADMEVQREVAKNCLRWFFFLLFLIFNECKKNTVTCWKLFLSDEDVPHEKQMFLHWKISRWRGQPKIVFPYW